MHVDTVCYRPGIDVIIFSSVLARYTGLTGVVGLWGYLLGKRPV